MFINIMCGAIFIAIGVFTFIKSELVWKLMEQRKYRYADEPSALYKLTAKFCGIILALLGIAAIILPFIPE